ncbi:relaxase/mobilization nuclease domain-containing protein [Mucilaginibacter sp. 10I4]|uniref:relaxase/mobilization nuclease domain-containing protein n=1 Tax=Mucilaginibacter sp. 10I4 TaxID=3048580 RepID=UPI002B228C38|nr:relaxase/mobilization nuclease domain-containing protein [Mucilaginibacter sp. 10I4]MEB0260515.1 relaxase/mobilization nuclease domain-containing protein [Mucilaginibacter sp. 10I4]
MTADQVKGKGFRGALNYNLEKVNKGVAKWLDTSFAQHDERTVMNEVKMIRVLRPNLAKYFYHTSVNFPPHENLKDEQMVTIAKDYLEAMGFDQHQYAIFRHFDADHPHMHILVNRIGYDGTVLSDSKDYQRSEQILRKLEKQYGLTEVISSRQAKERAMTKNELEMMKRTDEPSVKMKLQVTIKNILSQKPTAEQFIKHLEAQCINVLFNQASTGFVSGISYGYEGMQFKGAHLGNAYKWQSIKNAINYEQERDRTAIYQANVRTRANQPKRTGESTGATKRAIADTKVAAGNRNDVQQGTGKLQDQIGKANRNNGKAAQSVREHSGQPIISNKKYRGERGADLSIQQSGRQQMGNSTIPGRDLIGDLLGVNNNADSMDQNALNQFKRNRKKKRGNRLG